MKKRSCFVACLMIMIILLSLNLVRPFFFAGNSFAREPIQYKLIVTPALEYERIQGILTTMGAEGWDLVAVQGGYLYFKR